MLTQSLKCFKIKLATLFLLAVRSMMQMGKNNHLMSIRTIIPICFKKKKVGSTKI